MNYLEFKKRFQEYIVFSLNDIYKTYPNFNRLQLTRWQKKGYLTKIIKGYYLFSDSSIDEETLFFIANKIYNPSYISSEMALYYYGLIPETVYQITSISSRKTYHFASEFADFDYKKMQTKLFWGYSLVPCGEHYVKIAEPEKALLDYFYLNSNLNSKEDFFELRLNAEVFREKIDMAKFKKYLGMFGSKALEKRVKVLLEII